MGAIATLLFAASAAVLFLFLDAHLYSDGQDRDASQQQDTTELSHIHHIAAERWQESSDMDTSPKASQLLSDEFNGFRPEEVLGNPECRQRVAASGDISMVIMPSPDGTKFAALGGTGVLSFGEVPFRPIRYDLARRADGTVMVALGHQESTHPGKPPAEFLLPVRVYLDNQVIFEHDRIWDFGLASDGSSYFVVEPLAAEASRLVIHSLNQGSERHYDLGETYRRYDGGEISHSIWYSADNHEVMLYPGFDGIGTHHFFSVAPDGRAPRKIVVPEELGVIYSSFASSETGYMSFRDPRSKDSFVLTRRDIEWMPEDTRIIEKWRRSMSYPSASDQAWSFSMDGSLMLTDGHDLRLIDTATGNTVFLMPTVDMEAQLPRLKSVLPPDAGIESVGYKSGSRLIGEHLVIFRELSTPESSSVRIHDVIKLQEIEFDSGPSHRYVDLPGECAPGTSVVQGLQEHDGHLAFLSTTEQEPEKEEG